MYTFIRNYQLDIMLALCAVSLTMTVLLLITRFLPQKRKWILISMELMATLLLGFDRFAYIYSGDTSSTGYVMVRLSNFMVFFLTSAIVFGFNIYLSDLMLRESIAPVLPKRLKFVGFMSIIGMLLAILTVFTGFYYYFDEKNVYHRGAGFLACYVIPVGCPLLQFSSIYKFRKKFSRFIFIALILYIFVPILTGITQIFAYGISIVNMAMVLVSVSLYIFTYLDINDDVEKAHNMEMEALKQEQNSMKRLFSQTAKAFSTALEKRDESLEGFSQKVADYAFQIAKECGKSDEECEKAYYAALLHRAGIESLPDSLIKKDGDFTDEEEKLIQNIPLESSEILSVIKEFPFLSESIRHIHERFDGKGIPDRLKGPKIPETSRIIAVAEAYVSMTSIKNSRFKPTNAVIREEFVKEAGSKYDPVFSNMMVHLMDTKTNEKSEETVAQLETELTCGQYRDCVSEGIPVLQNHSEISFSATATEAENGFSAPSIILFDSYDRQVHHNQQAIEANHYVEYGEIWFDGHIISTSARNMEVQVTDREVPLEDKKLHKIKSARFEDHLLINLETFSKSIEVIVALPNISKSAYIAITGENCRITGIKTEVSDIEVKENEIKRIASQISYIDHMETDIPNVQINSPRQAYTQGIEIKSRLKLLFHTMSLPEANLIWHCPYIVLYHSEDGSIGGKDYREYALIKLNGEDNGSNSFAENTFSMKKDNFFESWDKWNQENKAGFECSIEFVKKGNKVTLTTSNLGISIKNVTEIFQNKGPVFAAITGDRCAITDIRTIL
ncbi:MAG: diguanylate cyclase [Treponema sp.]|nr:diguanylate cyclase [Treponema sp.]